MQPRGSIPGWGNGNGTTASQIDRDARRPVSMGVIDDHVITYLYIPSSGRLDKSFYDTESYCMDVKALREFIASLASLERVESSDLR